ncbi:MAG: hypothetical protein HY327_09505 [Chloroflexi bacterium]|nr:hypothetical protein [Chloroflexota bacterium]
MSAANVLSIHALEDLKAALTRFSSEGQEVLDAAAQEIRRTLDWLVERQNHWQVEVRRRQEIVAQARASLARCQASGFYDREGHYHPPDCSRQERALLEAQRYLAEAEAELRNAQQWMQKVQQAVSEYQREAQRLAQLVSSELPKASAFLQRKINDLERYRAVTIAPTSAQIPISSPPATTIYKVEGIPWAEHQAILKKMEEGLPITVDELNKLKQPISDLQTETSQDDNNWVQQLLDSERYREAMRGSREAKDLRDALFALAKALKYWHKS